MADFATVRLLSALLKSTMDSLSILERIEAKLDAQTIGKLRGAFRSILTAGEQPKEAKITIQIALGSFNECAEYFRTMSGFLESKTRFTWVNKKVSNLKKVFGWGKMITGSAQDLLGFGGGQLNKMFRAEVEMIECINLNILSEIGRIACMNALDYSVKTISHDLTALNSTNFEIDADPLYMERLTHLGLMPEYIQSMEKREFERNFGAIIDYYWIHPMNKREETKAFVVKYYGKTIPEIKRRNLKVYNTACLLAGREPRNLDEFIEMTMEVPEKDDGLIDKLLDKVEKNFFYWTDKDTLDKWSQAFFRYAALITLLKTNQTPQELLNSAASRGLSGC